MAGMQRPRVSPKIGDGRGKLAKASKSGASPELFRGLKNEQTVETKRSRRFFKNNRVFFPQKASPDLGALFFERYLHIVLRIFLSESSPSRRIAPINYYRGAALGRGRTWAPRAGFRGHTA